MSSLKQKTVSGFFWTGLQLLGSRGISFVVMLFLARLLTPSDFGLVGMLLVFVQVSQSLVNGGFKQALIQKIDADEEDYSSVFFINLIVSIVVYLILFFVAPLIAKFYGQPQLTTLARVIALLFIINAFSYVQATKLTKELNFKKLMIIQLPATIVGGICSITAAFFGLGVWSLIIYQLINRLGYCVRLWQYSNWKPLWSFNFRKASGLFVFGGNLMGSAILNTLYRNVYIVIIGRMFPISVLGYYQNANNLIQYPAQTLSTLINTVTFSSFSRVQNDDEKLKLAYSQMTQSLFLILIPIFILVGISAEQIILVVFGDKWVNSTVFLQYLCVLGVLYPVNMYNLNAVINVKGKSKMFLKLEFIKKTATIIGILFVSQFGIIALLQFQVASLIFEYLINSYYSGRVLNYPLSEQFKNILPILCANALMFLIVFVVDLFLINDTLNFIRVTLAFFLGLSFYFVTIKVLKVSSFLFVHNLVTQNMLKKAHKK